MKLIIPGELKLLRRSERDVKWSNDKSTEVNV